MWIAKFRVWHKDCLLRPLCVNYKITDFVHLISSWTKGKYFFYCELHILQGLEENQKQFIQELKKDKTLISADVSGNHIFTLNKKSFREKYYSPIFDKGYIYVKPVVQRSDGFEDWEIACVDKNRLMKIKKIPTFEVQLISIAEKALKNIFIPHIAPDFSPKQKLAIELAVKQGYYDYPRKIKLEELAKQMKVKRQTFQENLRRAERKLIPFLVEG